MSLSRARTEVRSTTGSSTKRSHSSPSSWTRIPLKPAAPFRPAYQISRNFGYGNAELGSQAEISFAGRKWVLHVAPKEAYVARHVGSASFLILLASLGLTALVCGLAIVQTDHQRELVADREKALEDQKFALDQHAIVSITDASGRIIYANDKFCRTPAMPATR